ncbi:MAG: dTMP kinase [Parcubacteria group bacterium Gr01-1014_38]|nr:MAG: dTMP kinase [Parcubacteria group bacterium Gr01-1014_38]
MLSRFMGILIVNEGADGSGKETQTTLLCERLKSEGYRVERFDFPTYGRDPVADLIKSLLSTRQAHWNERTMESRALLYAANRALFRDELRGFLETPGTIVVCNRYVASNQAHMAGYLTNSNAWEERFAWIERLEFEHIGLPRPDIVLFHTMPHAKRAALLEKREQGKQDAHERDAEYLQRVEQCYALLARRHAAVWRHIPADVHGRVEAPPDVHVRVWETLAAHPAWREFVQQRVRVGTP